MLTAVAVGGSNGAPSAASVGEAKTPTYADDDSTEATTAVVTLLMKMPTPLVATVTSRQCSSDAATVAPVATICGPSRHKTCKAFSQPQ